MAEGASEERDQQGVVGMESGEEIDEGCAERGIGPGGADETAGTSDGKADDDDDVGEPPSDPSLPVPEVTTSDSMLSPPARELKALTSAYPLDESQIAQLMVLINKCSADDLTKLGYATPVPLKPPKNLEKMPVKQRLETIQSVISSYQYNHTTQNFFNINKDRVFSRIMDTARDIMRDALPIRCVEGAFLGMYLTCGQEDLDRIALRFKTKAGGRIYRHIVLAVHHRPSKTWGALGLSRRKELMYKEMGFDSLSALITDFKESYEGWWHKVEKIRVGLPAEHNMYYNGRINFCHVAARPQRKTWEHWCHVFDDHASKMRKSLDLWRQLGSEAGKEAAAYEAYRKSFIWNTKTQGSSTSNKKGKGKKKGSKGSSRRVYKVSDDGSLSSTVPETAETAAEGGKPDGTEAHADGSDDDNDDLEEEEEGEEAIQGYGDEAEDDESDDSEEEELDVDSADGLEGSWQVPLLPGDDQVEVLGSDDNSHSKV